MYSINSIIGQIYISLQTCVRTKHASQVNCISPSLLHGPYGPLSALAGTCSTMLHYIDDGLACMVHICLEGTKKLEMNLGEIEIEVEESFMYDKQCVLHYRVSISDRMIGIVVLEIQTEPYIFQYWKMTTHIIGQWVLNWTTTKKCGIGKKCHWEQWGICKVMTDQGSDFSG